MTCYGDCDIFEEYKELKVEKERLERQLNEEMSIVDALDAHATKLQERLRDRDDLIAEIQKENERLKKALEEIALLRPAN